ncbi:hypothetical protein LTR56_007511 [Elasticomyces elasticus]|nr:hypothetical protein LTR56_007511 [Elasticomyces elasticus]KAK3668167.1 hypothetical protein LTR22_000852 [Elasticomyces elasticus]KAK5769506.1 hypothetical protein LTS12_000433 [Elasticomyces elasticus]
MSRQPNGHRNVSGASNPSMTSHPNHLNTPANNQRSVSPGSFAPSANTNSSMSRAERFEDEKKRVIDSCFSKTDANGQLSESYITHIRIIEDSQHPSGPPPPESPETNKKPRLIIIAVRSTGRVRMHKARENNNGSFSIGKTWNLEEMSAIETYSTNGSIIGGTTMPPEQRDSEALHRQWAGNTGFTVTITKPYYWQAGTSKEKDFFIASAVKIYRKYTKGLVPELKGFDDTEREQLLGTNRVLTPQQAQVAPGAPTPSVPASVARHNGMNVSPGMRAESGDMDPVAPPQPPFAQRPQSREESRYRQSPGPPASIHDAPRPGSAVRQQSDGPATSRWAPPAQQSAQPPLQAPRAFASQEHMRSQSPARSFRADQAGRPGTSPAPRPGQGRTPPPQQQQIPLQPPTMPSARDESPGGSSLASSAGHSRPQVRAASPPRERRAQQPQQQPYRETQEVEHPASLRPPQQPPQQQQTNGTGPAAGANLFAATRQRWMQNDQRPQSPSAPQLPPLETSVQPSLQPSSAQPRTGASEASSAGFDFGDAAAIGAITSFWAPEHSSAPTPTPPPAIIEEPASPPTPERSARRPPIHDRGMSDAHAPSPTQGLRPAPLRGSGGRSASASGHDEGAGGSLYGTPRDGNSALSTPRTEEPPQIKPLAVRDKRVSVEQTRPMSSRAQNDVGKLTMPGGFVSTPGPSPMGTPAVEAAPAREKVDEAAVLRAKAEEAQVAADAEAERQRLEEEEEAAAADAYRPGLGPMIKKTAVRDKFKKAAAAAGAFKPRPGGAAEKILLAKAQRQAAETGEVDGVSGFVPRPGAISPTPAPAVGVDVAQTGDVAESVSEGARAREGQPPQLESVQPTLPNVEVNSPVSPMQKSLDSPGIMGLGVQLSDEAPKRPDNHLQTPDQFAQQEEEEGQAERDLFEQREVRKPLVKVKRRGAQTQRNLAAIGIDPALLEGKALDFESTLTDIGYLGKTGLEPKQLSSIEADLRREQGRLEAGTWLSQTDAQRDEKVNAVDALFDRAIDECDDLERMLTLYSVELGSINEDVANIEAQAQGLQVQSANQKGLMRELEGLIETMSLDRRVLEPLRRGDLGDSEGLAEVESSLVRLWQAMSTIDPSLQSGRVKGKGLVVSGGSGEASEPLSQMRALREKKEVYDREATTFVQRLMQHLDQVFAQSYSGAKSKVLRPASGGAKRLNKEVFIDMRLPLWMYGPLMLFVKEINAPAWGTVLRMYYQKAGPVYADAFRENLVGWKGAAKKSGPEEAELLFTTAEKEDSSAAGGNPGVIAARKLTIKRSQTLAKTLRTASGGKGPADGSRGQGQMMCSEVFGGAMDEMAPLISQEQNFIAELFHATGSDTQDFVELVSATPPEQRRATNLLMPRPMDPDREMAKQVTSVMEQLFGSFAQEIGALLEWAVATDPIQGVGVMASLSRHTFYLQESSQEFLLQLLEGLSGKLQTLWSKFVDEQVRAIEDTKVKIKKRKGVIGFMKVFPHFAAAVENVFSAVAREEYERPGESMYEVRRLVDDAYGRINRAMFDSLKTIAKSNPTAAAGPQSRAGAGGDDPEDKEMLNYHILMIENMNHYIEEVDDGGKEGVLAEWRGKAMLERAEALDAYVKSVVTRPLGKLSDFVESTESLLTLHPTNPLSIASGHTNNRKQARNMFSQYDSKEIRRGAETLRKRVEKHFGDADEEVISRGLVALVGKECERAYEQMIDRMEKLIKDIWPPTEGEKPVEVDFTKEDVRSAFKSLHRS